MSTNKIALLDTDFTNKMYISKQDDMGMLTRKNGVFLTLEKSMS